AATRRRTAFRRPRRGSVTAALLVDPEIDDGRQARDVDHLQGELLDDARSTECGGDRLGLRSPQVVKRGLEPRKRMRILDGAAHPRTQRPDRRVERGAVAPVTRQVRARARGKGRRRRQGDTEGGQSAVGFGGERLYGG